MDSAAARQRRTFLMDCVRGGADGALFSLVTSVVLVIGVQVFAVPDGLIALLSAAPFIGNLLSLFYAARFAKARRTKSQLAGLPLFAAALLLALASVISGGTAFALSAALAAVFFNLRLAFLTAIYRENYERSRLGTLFSRGMLASIVMGLIASYTFGQLLDRELQNYRWVLAACAVAAVVSGTAILNMPSGAPDAAGAGNPFKNLTLIKKNPAFGYLLLVWFVFGFANLAQMPLRVVYLAEAQRGLGLSPFTVLLLTSVISEAARLISTPLWARAFDRWNFLALRMVLNAFLGIGCVCFFASASPWLIGLGSICSGIGLGGGGIAWNLWVTHYAPAKDTHVYMSVHTFLTGVRGVIGPYVGVLLLDRLGFITVSWLACGMIFLSVLMLAVPLMRGNLRPTHAPR